MIDKKQPYPLMGCLVGEFLGAFLGGFLGMLPAIDDIRRGTHYATVHGASTVLMMFVPIALIETLFFGVIGFIAGLKWRCSVERKKAEERERQAEYTQQSGNVWPPAPKKETR